MQASLIKAGERCDVATFPQECEIWRRWQGDWNDLEGIQKSSSELCRRAGLARGTDSPALSPHDELNYRHHISHHGLSWMVLSSAPVTMRPVVRQSGEAEASIFWNNSLFNFSF